LDERAIGDARGGFHLVIVATLALAALIVPAVVVVIIATQQLAAL
jgi:hypothetical protein